MEDEMGGACSTHGKERNRCRILVEYPEQNIPVRRPRCRWENYMKVDLKDIGRAGMDWIHLEYNGDHWRLLLSRQ
jgi:hypothetical protein